MAKNNIRRRLLNAQSMGATFNSSPTNIERMDNVSIQTNVSGSSSPVGTFKVQVSNDYEQDADGTVRAAGNWIDVTGLSQAISGDTQILFELALTAAAWVRLVYTRTSGTATANAYLVAKEA